MKTKTSNAEQQERVRCSALLGRFFHSVEDGKIGWQGSIVGNPEPGWYLVQLFGWLDGSPNVQRLMRIEDMREWLFYDDTEMMQFSYDHGVARVYDDTEMMQFSYDHGVAREGGKYRERASA